MSNETALCWGGGVTQPAPVQNVEGAKRIALGDARTCARIGDSTVHCWDGTTHAERVQGLYEASDVAMAKGAACAVMKDGWLRCWGKNDSGQLGDGTLEDKAVPTPIHY